MIRRLFFPTLTLCIVLLFSTATFATWHSTSQEQASLQGTPAGTAFTFQGYLAENAAPANGSYDFEFRLFDSLDGGSQIGSTITESGLEVTDGQFTVILDFGEVYDGSAIFLDTAVRPTSVVSGMSVQAFVPLLPRRTLRPAPYAQALPGLYTKQAGDSPNLVGGYRENVITGGVKGAAISGGGEALRANKVTDAFGSIAGGAENVAGDALGTVEDAAYAAVGGGAKNKAEGSYSAVAGGTDNVAKGVAAAIAGGEANAAMGPKAAVGGGIGNSAAQEAATVAGGENNTASGIKAAVGGGTGNVASALSATVAGGAANTAEGLSAAVGGGTGNLASKQSATVAGGESNTASGAKAAVGGGTGNLASAASATIAGGTGNSAAEEAATVAGGESNTASGAKAAVGGGTGNTASAAAAAVAGGEANAASGAGAAVPGGKLNQAAGDYSLAAGQRAQALHKGTFVWADSTAADYASTATDQFRVRATGGVSFDTAGAPFMINGAEVSPGGSPYANVVVVAKSGGDFSSIQAALDNISASDSNRYLVWVAPGSYNERVTMEPYVDIEGAGQGLTTITYSGSTSVNTGTVVGSDQAELRDLTVENTGGTTYGLGIYNSGVSPRITRVTAQASGATNSNHAIYNHNASSPTLTQVTAIAQGGDTAAGVYSNDTGTDPVLIDVHANGSSATSSYGLFLGWGAPTLLNVTAEAAEGTYNTGIFGQSTSYITMTNVTARGTGGARSYGINIGYTDASLTNIIASGSDGTELNYGLKIDSNGTYTQTLVNVTGMATGSGSTNYALWDYGVNMTLNNCTLHASGGASNYAFYIFSGVDTGYTVKLNNSQLTGSTNTVRSHSKFTVLVGGTLLDGGGVDPNGGTVTCAGVYDEAYTFYASTCP